jgi:hypothetical protein
MRRTFHLMAMLFAIAGLVIMSPAPGFSVPTPGGGGHGNQTAHGTTPKNAFNIMMNYELGMHCTGFEFAYCCILPPYNSILAQVVKTEKTRPKPRLLPADPNVGLDGLGRPTVVRDQEIDSNKHFKKYQLRYWHDAQPRNDGNGAPQTSTLISLAEGNSLQYWNTKFDAAVTDSNGALIYSTAADNIEGGKKGVMLGDGDFNDPNDNYQNAIWNHLYIYQDLEGTDPGGTSAEIDKIRLGIHVIYPENTGAALHPLGPGVVGAGFDNVLTFSGETGTIVFTQMKVLENLPIMLTSPRIWEALGLPLTPFEDTINFFGDPGAIDEDSLRPFVKMNAQLEEYPSGDPVLDNGNPVIGFGTAPIDIPNCERCHSTADGPINSAQTGKPGVEAMVQNEIDFWNAYYNIDTNAGDSDWYSRLKGAAISILAIHDAEHGTHFMDNWPGTTTTCSAGNSGAACQVNSDCDTSPGAGDGVCSNLAGDTSDIPQNTRLGHQTVICQRCHADNVIAVVKSATVGSHDHIIKPITEAIHRNHRITYFDDSLGRSGNCQGCHPSHRSDGDMSSYPITETGDNAFAGSDNRDAAGGCFVGRDVHSNRNKDAEATTPSHLNAVGQWLKTNVAEDTGTWKGIWCTNCHSQLSQEIWKTENCEDLIHGDCITNPRGEPTLADVAASVGVSETQAISWLDPKGSQCTGGSEAGKDCHTDADCGGGGTCVSLAIDGVDNTNTIWSTNAGLCDYLANGSTGNPRQDANVATIEVDLSGGGSNCSNASASNFFAAPGPDCDSDSNPDFYICGSTDVDGDFSVNILDFCTTADCVAAAQATLTASAAVPVPFSAADDANDHWLAAGEPHCADCHQAPYVEQSGNISAYPPFNYPRKASLFRYTRGHQDITCQGCHESIHGLYPVTPPGYVPGSTKAIDQTSWDQAASMNTDGSHGPLKCGACHAVSDKGVPAFIVNLKYNGQSVKNNFDRAVSWAHTFTEGADPTQDLCLNCHNDRSSKVSCSNGEWTEHALKGRVSRSQMDEVENKLLLGVCGSTDPLNTVCLSCHEDHSDDVSCSRRGWLRHLDSGRVAESVWEAVSTMKTGGTCGY